MEQTEAVSGTPGGGERKAATALKVVVAVDASEESLHALSWALDNIVRCHPDATLVVVHFAYPVAAHGIDTSTTRPDHPCS
jgi:predicted TIM-barrel fold metal-dependent hydrolase